MKKDTETSSHSILDTSLAKLVIGKSYLGDFVKSVCVFIFYGVIILLATMLLVAKYGGSSASAAVVLWQFLVYWPQYQRVLPISYYWL